MAEMEEAPLYVTISSKSGVAVNGYAPEGQSMGEILRRVRQVLIEYLAEQTVDDEWRRRAEWMRDEDLVRAET